MRKARIAKSLLAAPPGTEYKCEVGNDAGDYCSCSSYLDCVKMVVTGNCSSELTCGDGECFCDAA